MAAREKNACRSVLDTRFTMRHTFNNVGLDASVDLCLQKRCRFYQQMWVKLVLRDRSTYGSGLEVVHMVFTYFGKLCAYRKPNLK